MFVLSRTRDLHNGGTGPFGGLVCLIKGRKTLTFGLPSVSIEESGVTLVTICLQIEICLFGSRLFDGIEFPLLNISFKLQNPFPKKYPEWFYLKTIIIH